MDPNLSPIVPAFERLPPFGSVVRSRRDFLKGDSMLVLKIVEWFCIADVVVFGAAYFVAAFLDWRV
jgi:hypothetical protein